MATITATVSIASSDLVTDNINFSAAASLSATHTEGLSRKKITSTAKGTSAGQVTLYDASLWAAPAMVYVKNASSSLSDIIYIYANTASDDPIIGHLRGGDWALLPCNNTDDLIAYASGSGIVVEFMVIGTLA